MADEPELSPAVPIEAVADGNPVLEGQPGISAGVGQFHRDGRVRGSAEPEPGRCGRRLRNSDPPRYCTRFPCKGRTACPNCGGKSPAGIASPHYKNGAHSAYEKHLPKLVRGAFRAAMDDESLLSLKEDIALWKGRAVELVAQLESNPLPPWKEALGLANKVTAAFNAEDTEAVRATMTALQTFLKDGMSAQKSYDKTWRQLQVVLDQRRVTAVAEWKRLNELNAVVSVEDAMKFVRALLTAAKEVITDQEQLKRLQERTIQFLPVPEGQQ